MFRYKCHNIHYKNIYKNNYKMSVNKNIKKTRGRPRGRPKGSYKNNSKNKFENIKRPRGRPRKNVIESNNTPNNNILFKKIKSFENNQNKNIFNNIFSSEIYKIIIHNNGLDCVDELFCGVLDSVEHNTSNQLIRLGFEKNNILIPEKNLNTMKIHKNNGYNCFYGDLDDFTSKIDTQHIYTGWYFDTCGQINKQKNPILNVIKKTTFNTQAIIGFTFCKTRIKKEIYNEQKNVFLNELQNVLSSKNFELIEIFIDLDYSGTKANRREKHNSLMNTFICRIQKINYRYNFYFD